MAVADLLQVSGLTVSGDNQRLLLDDVSFSMRPGEVVGVLGPNGAGKTTLLRCLFGALRQFSGSVHINGRDISTLTDRQRALQVAAVTQEMPADFQLSVRSVIATGRTPHQHWFTGNDPDAEKVIDEAIRQFHLRRYLDRDISELSGGERKRVMICRALVQQPELLVLDEPCNHLDIEHQLSLMQLLRKLPVSSLVSLHDFPLAARYCDRVLVMQQGRLVGEGTPADVLTPELFENVFAVRANTYSNPWEQWSFYATSLPFFSCTKKQKDQAHAHPHLQLSDAVRQSGAA
ncbi:ABC transporter ATP-binding protein [Aliamphritea hakodatensis]|uniref:ABC transporter ATP-binding protein n=1 Tax=Aliamphritea hakodatensis TaxID=2895352 RepID=UPI0022FD49E8|nr:ABC transporter ATP-binding protein [Aliamphritea hakodatensis]